MKGHGRSIRTNDSPTRNAPRQADVEVDLHGLRAHIGESRLENVMKTAIANGTYSVRVIHGHGQGVMKEIAEQWISTHPNNVEHTEIENGCILIILKPRR